MQKKVGNTCPTPDFGGGGDEGSRRESTILEIEPQYSISWVGVEGAERGSTVLKIEPRPGGHKWNMPRIQLPTTFNSIVPSASSPIPINY